MRLSDFGKWTAFYIDGNYTSGPDEWAPGHISETPGFVGGEFYTNGNFVNAGWAKSVVLLYQNLIW